MTAFAHVVAGLAGVTEEHLERLSGGDLSEILLVRRSGGHLSVAKGGAACSVEASMLRALSQAGVPAPQVEADHGDVIFLQFIPNDGIFSPAAWRDIGTELAKLHAQAGQAYGWPVDYRIGTVELDNRQTQDWPRFWIEQRVLATASLLDKPWRERITRLVPALYDRLPATPPKALLHGDLWTGNILVAAGRLAAVIDPACYHGDPEVDLAMLTLFTTPPEDFWLGYGQPAPGWEERRAIYQLFPALVHLRLFGGSYGVMVDRLLDCVGAANLV